MKVLIIYAHPNPMSFTKAILEHFVKGLKYFHSMLSVSSGTRKKYLETAFSKGKEIGD